MIDIDGFVAHVNAELRKDCEQFNPYLVEIGRVPQVRIETGPKYFRVVKFDNPKSEGGSAFCFVERRTGNILKAASWKAPAKGVRGNISDPNFGWGKAVGLYGAAYLR
jgi:hypothetical protein